jgi:small subunit ribosomal protein S8
MSQDIVADALNQIMNAKRASKVSLEIGRSSKLLINLLEMMKKDGHIDYDAGKTGVSVSIIKLNECRSVKPRYYVGVGDVDKYLRRFLPSRKLGSLIISTSKGLKRHNEAEEENLGGSVIAFYY